MSTLRNIRRTLVGAVLSAFAASAFAQVPEVEPNSVIGEQAQRLTIGSDGSASVNGFISTAFPVWNDIDFYSFQATAGDSLTVNIDMGHGDGAGKSVDTVVTVFGPGASGPFHVHIVSDNVAVADTPGSITNRDPRIDNPPFTLPPGSTGTWYVAVHPAGVRLLNGGVLATGSRAFAPGTGDYILRISGVTPPPSVVYIPIDIKPGDNRLDPSPINLKAKGNIPVALLSTDRYNVVEQVDAKSLTFGETGGEQTLRRCVTEDVNRDGLPDLMCHFAAEVQLNGFNAQSEHGILKGKTKDGRMTVEGRGDLKIRPAKLED